jgi:DNA topoisomerase-3
MESAGKTVEDEELREAMKENGIGRPSTRSSIIETLFKRRYIYRERKNIMASSAGIELIATINEELLKSAKLTGLWENKLRRIERGDYSAAEFINELKELIGQIVINVLSDNSARRIVVEDEKKADGKKGAKAAADGEAKPRKPRRKPIKSLEEIVCPKCGKGHILRGKTAYGCSRYAEGCDLRLSFDKYSPDLTPGKLATKIAKL